MFYHSNQYQVQLSLSRYKILTVMTSSNIFFLCTHTNIGLSVVYTCTTSLQPSVYNVYHISLGSILLLLLSHTVHLIPDIIRDIPEDSVRIVHMLSHILLSHSR